MKIQEIVENQPSVQELQERWPALFQQEEVIRSKGGVLREKTKDTIKLMDQSLNIDIRKDSWLKCLIMYLGEDAHCLIKVYQSDQREEMEREFEKTTMAFL